MKKYNIIALMVLCLAACIFLTGASGTNRAKSEFARTTINLGIVVSDVEKAAQFYKNALGFTEAPGKKVDNQFIHSSLGFSYLTIFVSDTTAAVERAKRAGVHPVKEPYQLGGGNFYLTLLKDPDGNIIELVGPKK